MYNGASTQNPVVSTGGLLNGTTSSAVPPRLNNIISVSTATTTLNVSLSHNGTTFLLAPAGALTINLPVVAASKGFACKFMAAAAAPGADATITPTANGLINGVVIGGDTIVACAAKNTLVIASANVAKGDYVSMTSDGQAWYVDARAQTAAAFS